MQDAGCRMPGCQDARMHREHDLSRGGWVALLPASGWVVGWVHPEPGWAGGWAGGVLSLGIRATTAQTEETKHGKPDRDI